MLITQLMKLLLMRSSGHKRRVIIMPKGINDNNGWHLRKEISFSHIITTCLIVSSVMKFGYDMDKRIALLEARQMFSETISHRSLSEISVKLDKHILSKLH